MTTHFRLRWIKRGGHVHVRMFSAGRENLTHGKNGDLVFLPHEWEAFLRCFQDRGAVTITVTPEDGVNP